MVGHRSVGVGGHRIAPLIAGLIVITVGAVLLGRSKAVARIAGGEEGGAADGLGGCRGCSPSPAWVYRTRGEAGELAAVGAAGGRREPLPAATLADDG